MGKIFYIIGRSASGKDKIFKALAGDDTLGLRKFVPYTTRPIREKEVDGVQYRFVSDAELDRMEAEGKVIEERRYDTVHGIWRYATVDEIGTADGPENYLVIGTIESYCKVRDRYGKDRVIPLYVDVREDLLLERALRRERKEAEPKYRELCRRFLADSEDFSEENIRNAGITRRFENNEALEDCIAEIREAIRSELA